MTDKIQLAPGFWRDGWGNKVQIFGPIHDEMVYRWVGVYDVDANTYTDRGQEHLDETTADDIVAPWVEPIEISGWINVDRGGDKSEIFDSEHEADRCANADRLACVFVSGKSK